MIRWVKFEQMGRVIDSNIHGVEKGMVHGQAINVINSKGMGLKQTGSVEFLNYTIVYFA